jgi:hypothetical protein
MCGIRGGNKQHSFRQEPFSGGTRDLQVCVVDWIERAAEQ